MDEIAFKALLGKIDNAAALKDFDKLADFTYEMLKDFDSDEATNKSVEIIENPELFTGLLNSFRKKFATETSIPIPIHDLVDYLLFHEKVDVAVPLYLAAANHDPAHIEEVKRLEDLYKNKKPGPEKILVHIAILEKIDDHNTELIEVKYAEAGALYYSEKDDMEKAAECFKAAISIEPKEYSYQYSLALALRYNGSYLEANKVLDKAFELAPSNEERAEVHFLRGEISLQLYKFHQACDYFLATIKLNNKKVYAYHNLVAAYRTLGDYHQSNHYLEKAIALYENEFKNGLFDGKVDKYYYYAELIKNYIPEKNITHFEGWEKMINGYCSVDSNDPDGARDMFYMLLCKKKAFEEGKFDKDLWKDEKERKWEEVYSNMMRWYTKAIENFGIAIANNPRPWKLKELYIEFGQLYLSFDMYEEAKSNFSEILKLDPNDVEAADGLGVAYFKTGEYSKAIEQFRRALTFNPGSLNIQCNLGDSYRCNGNITMAEQVYSKVLRACPKYVDALIGMGECNKSQGDKLLEGNEMVEAESSFRRARSWFEKAIELIKQPNTSRQLTIPEQNALYYSSGYTKVRLFELGKGANFFALNAAKNELKKVNETSPEYVKARKAIRLINEKLAGAAKAKKIAYSSIFIFAFLIFAGTQYVAISNYLSKGDKVYTVSSNEVRNAGQRAGKDSASLVNSMTPLLLKQYTDIDELQKMINDSLPRKLIPFLDMKVIAENKVIPKVNLDAVNYAFFTFSSILFMVVGLFLPYITRLKVGTIEMDKNSVDTVKTTTSMIKAA